MRSIFSIEGESVDNSIFLVHRLKYAGLILRLDYIDFSTISQAAQSVILKMIFNIADVEHFTKT